jgi:hypothetical protein
MIKHKIWILKICYIFSKIPRITKFQSLLLKYIKMENPSAHVIYMPVFKAKTKKIKLNCFNKNLTNCILEFMDVRELVRNLLINKRFVKYSKRYQILELFIKVLFYFTYY